MRNELGLRHEGVDEAERVRLLAVERLGEQEEFRRLGAPEALRREERRSGLRHEAKVDERHLEARLGRGVDEIAVKEKRRSDADREAVDRRDQRLFELGELADEPRRRKVARRARRDGEKIAKVVSGGEHAPLAAQHEERRRSASRSAASKASISASYIAPVIAFFFCGRAKAAHMTAPSRPTSISFVISTLGHALSARIVS